MEPSCLISFIHLVVNLPPDLHHFVHIALQLLLRIWVHLLPNLFFFIHYSVLRCKLMLPQFLILLIGVLPNGLVQHFTGDAWINVRILIPLFLFGLLFAFRPSRIHLFICDVQLRFYLLSLQRLLFHIFQCLFSLFLSHFVYNAQQTRKALFLQLSTIFQGFGTEFDIIWIKALSINGRALLLHWNVEVFRITYTCSFLSLM